MQLIFGDMRPDFRQLGHLMSLRLTDGLRLFQFRGQSLSAALALLGQEMANFIDSLRRNQGPMCSPVARLSTRLTPALLAAAPQTLLTG
jgi:hypothetical protein